ncbi:MAG: UbiA family prenyltransferase [Nitrososphaerota archaeon]|nr:UbiA family prenyltransferase [Nitrososphaerota archaeon]MDG7021790.1 UbiA family prenyltransferase [Nitrososphaerota archaeon]
MHGAGPLDIKASFSMMRPVNCAMIGFAVMIGYFVSKPPSASPLPIALGFVTGFAICAFSMVANDYYDVEVDRVNQPARPLPSGAVSKGEAVALAATTLVVGLAAASATLDPYALLIAALYAALAWLYDYRVKAYGLVGNLIVASSLAIPFVYGGVVSGGDVAGSLLLFMASTSLLAGVGREVVKAMADVPGDQKRGIRSYAAVHGLRSASLVGALFFLLAVVTSLLPLLLLHVNAFYRFGVVLPDAAFVYLAYSIVTRADAKGALRVKRTALMGMLLGLIVFVGGAF